MLPQEFKALRKAIGYKGYQLAEALDISAATVSRYERGHAPIPRVAELAVRYLCEPSVAPPSAEQRLIEAIREVAQQDAAS